MLKILAFKKKCVFLINRELATIQSRLVSRHVENYISFFLFKMSIDIDQHESSMDEI